MTTAAAMRGPQPANFSTFSTYYDELKNPSVFLQRYGDEDFSAKMAEIAKTIKTRKLGEMPPGALSLGEVITPPTFRDSRDQNAIAAKFNRATQKDDPIGLKAVLSNMPGGEWIHPGNYWLVHYNNIGYIIPPQNTPVKLAVNTTISGDKGGDIHKPHQNDLYFGMNGKYVVNIPRGYYGKVKLNNAAALLGEGVHVILDPTFVMDRDEKKSLVPISQRIILWGSIVIVQVPEGQILKLRHSQKFYLLESREQPYVYNDPNIVLTEQPLVNVSDEVISHGSLTRVMVGSNHVAIIKHNGNMGLLYPQADPYILGANYKFDKIINTSDQIVKLFSAKIPELALSTQDNFIVHMDLMLTYRFPCLEYTLRHLNSEDIQSTIISTVISEMELVVRGLPYANSLSASQAVVDNSSQNELSAPKPAILRSIANLSAERLIQERLAREYGISMTKVAILHADVARPIAEKMEQAALANAELQTRLVSMDTKLKIAEQELKIANINTETTYQSKIAQARIFREFPEVLELEKVRFMADALKSNTKILDVSAFQTLLGGVFNNSMIKGLDHLDSDKDPLLVSSKSPKV